MWQPLFDTLPAPYVGVVMLWLTILTGVVIVFLMVSLWIIFKDPDFTRTRKMMTSLSLFFLMTVRRIFHKKFWTSSNQRN